MKKFNGAVVSEPKVEDVKKLKEFFMNLEILKELKESK